MAENTEIAILEAAKKVFTKSGFSGARMQEIADEAKINKAMLHYYFRSKEKLFQVIIEDTMALVVEKFGQALESEGTVIEKFEKIIEVYISNIKENPHLPIFILHELSQNRLQFLDAMKGKIHRLPNFIDFFQQIQEEQEAGLIKPIPPIHLLLNVMSMCVFPFVVKPVFCNIIEIPEEQFDLLMDQRVEVVTKFVKSAIAV
jgi:TetR/AcrR family transcriptional regulator